MEILAYISVNILLFVSWYTFLYGRRECLSLSDRLVGTFTLGLTQIIVTQMLLGVIFKSLHGGPLFLLNTFISLALFIAVLMKGQGRGIFAEFRDEIVRIFRVITGDAVLLIIAVLFLISLLWMILIGYLFPSYSWDALYYHLPIAGQIIQSGSIQEHVTPSFIQQYMNIFSKNINLLFVWNIIFLKSDVLVDLTQLLFTLAGVLSVYSISVKLNIREKYAIYSSLLFFFTPVLILQSTINYVDVAVSMLFIMTVNFLLSDSPDHLRERGVFRRRRSPLILAGLSAGILLGSKPTGPVFICVIFGAVVLQEILRSRSALYHNEHEYSLLNGLKRTMIFFAVPAFLAGGYWYMRNWIVHGNPVYFMDVSLFGLTLFKGLKSDWVEQAPQIIESLNYFTRLLHVWLEKVGYYMYDSRLSGFGPTWFALFLPSIAFSAFHAVARKKYGFLFVLLLFAVTFIVHPRNWFARYVVFIVGLGAVSFGYVLNYFDRRENMLRFLALFFAVYSCVTINSPCIMPLQVKEFINLPAEERTLTRHKPFNIDLKVRNEYGLWMWIERNMKAGDTLVYTFVDTDLDPENPFFLEPLWNRAFSNRVVYIQSDTYNEWLESLKNNDVTHIVMKINSVEDVWIEKERNMFFSLRWMGNLTEKFKIVYADNNYKIAQFMGTGK